MLVTRQLMVAIDFHLIFFPPWNSMASVSLIQNSLKHLLCSTEERKYSNTGLEQLEGE